MTPLGTGNIENDDGSMHRYLAFFLVIVTTNQQLNLTRLRLDIIIKPNPTHPTPPHPLVESSYIYY